jgi:uncharacterized protein with von Willebrand factor type A (vWA) domain
LKDCSNHNWARASQICSAAVGAGRIANPNHCPRRRRQDIQTWQKAKAHQRREKKSESIKSRGSGCPVQESAKEEGKEHVETALVSAERKSAVTMRDGVVVKGKEMVRRRAVQIVLEVGVGAWANSLSSNGASRLWFSRAGPGEVHHVNCSRQIFEADQPERVTRIQSAQKYPLHYGEEIYS